MLFLIPTHCLRCIIIGYSKRRRFCAIFNSYALSEMHYYWLLRVRCFCAIFNSYALSKMHYYWLLKEEVLLCYF